MKNRYYLLLACWVLALPVKANDESDSLSLTANVLERYNVNMAAGGGVSDLIEVSPIDYTYSEWEEYGDPYNCQYEPEANTVDKGVVFSQDLYCVQKQMRYKYTWINAVLSKTETEYQEIDAEHTQDAVGTLTYTYVTEYGAWTNKGGVYSCSSYSPSQDTVDSGVSFAQSRTCAQNQSREAYTYKVNDVNGSRSLFSSATETKTISVNESRVVTGTKVVIKNWAVVYEIPSYQTFGPTLPTTIGINGVTYNRSNSAKSGVCDTTTSYFKGTVVGDWSDHGVLWQVLFYSCQQLIGCTDIKASEIAEWYSYLSAIFVFYVCF